MTTEGITYIEVDLQTSQHIKLYNSVFTYITVYLHIYYSALTYITLYVHIHTIATTHTLHAPITNHNNHMSRRTTLEDGGILVYNDLKQNNMLLNNNVNQ